MQPSKFTVQNSEGHKPKKLGHALPLARSLSSERDDMRLAWGNRHDATAHYSLLFVLCVTHSTFLHGSMRLRPSIPQSVVSEDSITSLCHRREACGLACGTPTRLRPAGRRGAAARRDLHSQFLRKAFPPSWSSLRWNKLSEAWGT